MSSIVDLELVQLKETIDDKIVIIRDDVADTKRMVRKLHFEVIPNLITRVDNLSENLDKVSKNIDLLINKLDTLIDKE